jgi:predicted 3-demethylubiquinone-9 3-methyltransferase (glyoxalase superfamily)
MPWKECHVMDERLPAGGDHRQSGAGASPKLAPQEPVFLDQVGDRLPLPALEPAGQYAEGHLQRRGVDHGVELISSAGLTDVGRVVEHYGAAWRLDELRVWPGRRAMATGALPREHALGVMNVASAKYVKVDPGGPHFQQRSIHCAKENMSMKPKNTICLWFNKDAHEAARFYAATFPNSAVTAVHKAPGDYPGGKQGEVLTVDFTVLGIPCLGLNGGPEFKHSEAFSFQIATDNQEETDRYWDAIVGNGGQESACGWCKDRWGLSWQITPRVLTDALAAGGAEAKRAFDAMMTMKKIDVATIEAARKGALVAR